MLRLILHLLLRLLLGQLSAYCFVRPIHDLPLSPHSKFWSDIYIIITQFICTPLYGVCVQLFIFFSFASSSCCCSPFVVVVAAFFFFSFRRMLLLFSFYFWFLLSCTRTWRMCQPTNVANARSLSLCERGEWETPLRILFRMDPPYFCIFLLLFFKND